MRTSIYYEHTCILQLYCGASSANHIRGRAQVLPTQFSGHVHYQQAAIIISSPDVPGLLQGLVNGLQHGAISQVVTSPTVDSSSTPSRYTAALQQTIDPASEPPRNQSPPADQGFPPEGRAGWKSSSGHPGLGGTTPPLPSRRYGSGTYHGAHLCGDRNGGTEIKKAQPYPIAPYFLSLKCTVAITLHSPYFAKWM